MKQVEKLVREQLKKITDEDNEYTGDYELDMEKISKIADQEVE